MCGELRRSPGGGGGVSRCQGSSTLAVGDASGVSSLCVFVIDSCLRVFVIDLL